MFLENGEEGVQQQTINRNFNHNINPSIPNGRSCLWGRLGECEKVLVTQQSTRYIHWSLGMVDA